MRWRWLLLVVAGPLVGCTATPEPADGEVAPGVEPLDLSSPALTDGADIPVEHTCDGGDRLLPLAWDAIHPDAVEVVLVMDDPDAPRGTLTHWLVAGLPVQGEIDRGLPDGAMEGRNDFGEVGYGGPCPPEGDDPHGYRIQLIAVSEPTALEPGFDRSELDAAILGQQLTAGTLTGRAGR